VTENVYIVHGDIDNFSQRRNEARNIAPAWGIARAWALPRRATSPRRGAATARQGAL
jgi:hypothetical protein